MSYERIQVVDSHTGGEPTRVVIGGGPALGRDDLTVRRELLRTQFDHFRSTVINEPRGSDVLVEALLCEPIDPRSAAGVIFFNNVGYLNMCGHGMIGLAVTLGHLGRIAAGRHAIETPVGIVQVEYDGRNRVTIENVPSYRHAKDVAIDVTGHGRVTGDIAWGGNWFFIAHDHGQTLEYASVSRLTEFACRIKDALQRNGITGASGGEIDHIELVGPPRDPANHARNFVLCPGMAYDRSPCGTGTSAKIACLVADGKLKPGEIWRQESIIGSVFEGTGSIVGDRVIPRITSSAYIIAESTIVVDDADPFAHGITQPV